MAIWCRGPVSSLWAGRKRLKEKQLCHPPQTPGKHWHDPRLGVTRCWLPPGTVRREASLQFVDKFPAVSSCLLFPVCEMGSAIPAPPLLLYWMRDGFFQGTKVLTCVRVSCVPGAGLRASQAQGGPASCQDRMAIETTRVGTKSVRIQSQKVSTMLRGLFSCGGCGLLSCPQRPNPLRDRPSACGLSKYEFV